MLEVQKWIWPECKKQKMDANACKAFIDLEIYHLFTGKDRYTRTVIHNKRKSTDQLYNVLTIYMNDQDMAIGRNGDGQVHYDL